MIIAQQFLRQVERHGEKIAIIYRRRRLTYLEVARQSEQLAGRLHQMGATVGSRVGLLLHNGPLFTVAMLATARLGAMVAPLPVAMGQSGLRAALRRLRLTHLIGESQALAALDQLDDAPPEQCRLSTAQLLEWLRQCSGEPSPPPLPDAADLPWVLTMTSGSTGDPKPIVLSQKCKLRRAIDGAKLPYHLSEHDVILTASPMYHSLGMRLGLLPLLIGATSVILHKFAPGPWLRSVEEEGVTFTIPVSHHLVQLLPLAEDHDLGSLRCLVSSSALLRPEEKRLCIERFRCRLHECYGTSEVGIVTDLSLSDAPATNSVGKPLPHVKLRVIDDEGNPCAPGEIGEILCRTTTAFSGYDGVPEATAAAFVDGYFRTGDLGYLDEQGYLYLKGRKKEVIKVGGVSVYPDDIERVILGFPGIRACAAVGIPDERLGERIAVALVPECGARFDLEALRRHCITQLADYQHPLRWHLLESLPETGLGKLQRCRLAEQLRSEAA